MTESCLTGMKTKTPTGKAPMPLAGKPKNKEKAVDNWISCRSAGRRGLAPREQSGWDWGRGKKANKGKSELIGFDKCWKKELCQSRFYHLIGAVQLIQ